MPLIILIVVLSILKYFEIGPFINMSWWWIVGLLMVTFLWFEFFERVLGLDKRQAHNQSEKTRKERIKRTFKQ